MLDSDKPPQDIHRTGLVVESDPLKASTLVQLLQEAGLSSVESSGSIEESAHLLTDEGLRIVMVGDGANQERAFEDFPLLLRNFSVFLATEKPYEGHCPVGFDGPIHIDGPLTETWNNSLGVVRRALRERDALAGMLAQEVHLRSIVDSTNDVVFTLDDKQRHTGIYGAWLKNLNDARERYIGKTPREIMGGEAARIHEEYNIKALRGETVSYEWQVPTEQGVRHYMTSLSPIRSEGTVKGIAGIARDITDRIAAEDALRRSEESIRTLLDLSPFSVIVHDINTMDVVYANTNAIKQSGFSSIEEMMEQGLEWADHPYSAADARRKALASIEEGPQMFQWISASKDGSRFWEQISLMVLPFMGEDRLLAVSVNIDEIKRMEASLRLTNKKLQLLSSLIRHDVMNKITALRGFTELAIDSCDCVSLPLLEKVELSAIAIQKDIEFMREYDRLGEDVPQWQGVSFSVSPATVVGVEVLRDINGLEVYADMLFSRVFENLIDNSIRHGGTVSRIRLSGHQDGEDFIIVWEDDGIGIPAADKERIFDRGFGKNTGFGLFLTRHILSLTDMEICEEGVEGQGARFLIRVPKGIWRIKQKKAHR